MTDALRYLGFSKAKMSLLNARRQVPSHTMLYRVTCSSTPHYGWVDQHPSPPRYDKDWPPIRGITSEIAQRTRLEAFSQRAIPVPTRKIHGNPCKICLLASSPGLSGLADGPAQTFGKRIQDLQAAIPE